MRYYCGIDLHSKKSTFCVLDEEGERVALKELRNDEGKDHGPPQRPSAPDLCMRGRIHLQLVLAGGRARGRGLRRQAGPLLRPAADLRLQVQIGQARRREAGPPAAPGRDTRRLHLPEGELRPCAT